VSIEDAFRQPIDEDFSRDPCFVPRLIGKFGYPQYTVMAELKTKETAASIERFIDAVPSEQVREDCQKLDALMQKITKQPGRMWGPSIIGYGSYHYKYASGHEGDMCLAGFSPRKANISLYIWPDETLIHKLGKHKAGKGCIYIKRLSDVDLKVLEELIRLTVKKNTAQEK
jgi:hypothetical protein